MMRIWGNEVMEKRLIVLCLVVLFLMVMAQSMHSPDKPGPKNQNPKHEIRNPKQYQNPNFQNSKQEQSDTWLFFLFWSFEFRSFEFVSNSDIRISDLKCLKSCHFLARFYGLIISSRAGSDQSPTAEEVLEAHRELLKRYDFEEKDRREMNEEEERSYSPGEQEGVRSKPHDSGGESISFLDWLRGLSLPIVLIIAAVLIILFYFMFRGVPGFFRESVDISNQRQTAVKEFDYRDDEVKTGDKGYHLALELAKKGAYGKALILLHKASIKKLQENRWIPLGRNFTNNDIRGLIQEPDTGMKFFTSFSQLAAAAERAAFKRENPGEETYAKLRQMYETAFLKMPARDRY